jgi:transposase
METMYYIGPDVHKRAISYCVKDVIGRVYAEGSVPATRFELDRWMKTVPQPWTAAMEATVFTGWIYDHLQPHAAALKVAHPVMLRAIAAAKKKNDRIDAKKICDCLRCDFLPECYMASTAIRERRRTLRYRNLLVRQMVQMKNKIGMLLMEAGVSYNKKKLHKAGYFRELLATNPDINEGLCSLLRLCRETVVRLQRTESALVRSLERDAPGYPTNQPCRAEWIWFAFETPGPIQASISTDTKFDFASIPFMERLCCPSIDR